MFSPGCSLRHLRSQVNDLRRRLKPVLAILRMRNLAMEFCDEFDEAALSEIPSRANLDTMCILFPSRIGQAGFRLDTSLNLVGYLRECVNRRVCPDPREMTFTSLPWSRKGPHLRPDLWERPCYPA